MRQSENRIWAEIGWRGPGRVIDGRARPERRIRSLAVLLALGLLCMGAAQAQQQVIFADGFGIADNCSPPEPPFCMPPRVDTAGLHINDLRVDPIHRGIEDAADPAPPLPWIELYNGGSSAEDLAGLELHSAVESSQAVLPSVSLPPAAFLTVYYLPAGTVPADFGLSNDLDFADGAGAFYGDFAGQPNPEADDLALVDGALTRAFVAWGEPLDPVSELETDAVADGAWTAGSRIPRDRFTAGESAGLLLDGFHRTLAGGARRAGGPSAPNEADYIVVPWVEQTAGIQQPSQPLQISPRDGQLFPAWPLTLTWRACPDASGYLVELYNGEGPDADRQQFITPGPELTLEAGDTDFNPVFWTVACLFDDNTLRSPFPERWLFGIAPTTGGGGSVPVVLGVDHQYQRKDSNALCLYDFARGNRYGCKETIDVGAGCNWDGPHDVDSATDVRACGPISENNCVRASIQMVYDFFTGGSPNLHQDYVSYLAFNALNPPGVADAGEPEGDLGAGIGMTRGQTRTTLAQVLGIDAGDILIDESPSFTDIRDWIDAGRPVILFRWWAGGGGHATVAYGYQTTPFNAVLIHDPTDGPDLTYRYTRYASRWLRPVNPITAIVPPASIGTPLGDPPNSDHAGSLFDDSGDSDGVVSFDELERFATDPLNFDTDYDQVNDRAEVHSYIFARGLTSIVTRRPDVDMDGFRAELDCDADIASGTTDPDGGEDIDGDGGHAAEPIGVGPGETDKFVAGGMDDDLALLVTPAGGPPGTDFTLSGGTLHGIYGYDVEAVDCLSPKLPGDAVGGGPWFTDASGTGDDVVFTCPRPGCWILYMDIADDNIWQNPAPTTPSLPACDTSFTVECQCVPGDGDDDSLRLDDSSVVLPEDNLIDDIKQVVISRYNPDPIELEVVTAPGTGGAPAGVRGWNLIFQVDDEPGSSQPDFSNNGFLWAQLQFDENGFTQPPQWFIWSDTGWQPEPPSSPDPPLNEQIGLAPTVDIEIVSLQLTSVQPITVGMQPRELTGLRVVTLGEEIGQPGPTADGMPDLQPVPSSPPLGNGFISLNSCP